MSASAITSGAESDRAAVTTLARELRVDLEGDERDLPLIPLYICTLLDEIANGYGTIIPDESKHPIKAIAQTVAWAIRSNRNERDTLITQAHDFTEMISRIDSDDGWPVDRWLLRIYQCCIAVHTTLELSDMIRWPAEAGMQVAQAIACDMHCLSGRRETYRAWAAERFISARSAWMATCAN